MMENCPGLVASNRPRVIPAALRLALNADQVRITYAGHSTFLIESPQLVRIATDYNDYVRPPVLPDIVTMNHAHYHALHRPARSAHPARAARLGADARPAGAPRHHVQGRARAQRADQHPQLDDGGTERHGNSIFIYEMANMCIAHLGHLHHTLNQQQLNEIGRVDVVFVPVDGNMTLDLEGMIEVLQRAQGAADDPDALFQHLHAPPLPRARARQNWTVEMSEVPSTVVSKTTPAGDAQGAWCCRGTERVEALRTAEKAEPESRQGSTMHQAPG